MSLIDEKVADSSCEADGPLDEMLLQRLRTDLARQDAEKNRPLGTRSSG